LKKINILSITLIFIIIITSNIIIAEDNKIDDYIISFNQYLDIEIDSSFLIDPVHLETEILIPVKIIYWTNIPDDFLKIIPRLIRNIILFGSIIEPTQEIHLEAINIPVWSYINFTGNNIPFSIPRGNNKKESTTNIIINLDKNATAQPYTVTIKGFCKNIGRINKFTYHVDFVFIPKYNPCISIDYENDVYTPPNIPINIDINVTNCGNKISIVTSTIITKNLDFTPTINPPQYVIDIDSANNFIFSAIGPYDFSGNFVMQIKLMVEVYPYRVDSPSEEYLININLHYP